MTTDMELLFPLADPACVFEDEENQTYESFVGMGKRRPNRFGTGRFKLSSDQNKVLVVYFGSKTNKPKHIDLVLSFLSTFLLLEVLFEEQFGAIDLKQKQMALDGKIYDIASSTKLAKKKPRKTVQRSSIDVFSLFDVLVHKAKRPHYCILGLFDTLLTEEDQPIMGRACGDRVRCMSACTRSSAYEQSSGSDDGPTTHHITTSACRAHLLLQG